MSRTPARPIRVQIVHYGRLSECREIHWVLGLPHDEDLCETGQIVYGDAGETLHLGERLLVFRGLGGVLPPMRVSAEQAAALEQSWQA